MGRRLDYDAARSRSLMRERGTDAVDGSLPGGLSGPPRRHLSKAAQRQQIEAALAAYAPSITCAACGRSGPAAPARAGQRPRCPRCGAEAGRP